MASMPSGLNFMQILQQLGKGLVGGAQGASSNSGSIGTPVNATLGAASAIPGPQQPFVAGAAAIAPTVESLFGGGKSSAPPPRPSPMLPHPAAPPMALPSITNPPPTAAPHALPSVGAPTPGTSPSVATLIQALMKMKGGMGG